MMIKKINKKKLRVDIIIFIIIIILYYLLAAVPLSSEEINSPGYQNLLLLNRLLNFTLKNHTTDNTRTLIAIYSLVGEDGPAEHLLLQPAVFHLLQQSSYHTTSFK